jgi:4-hydroxyacetophenone monooxygenase
MPSHAGALIDNVSEHRKSGQMSETTSPHDVHGAGRDDLAYRAIQAADPNILRLALLHATGDESLAHMRTEMVASGLFPTQALGEEHHGEVRDKARAFLRSGAAPAAPGKERIREIMSVANGADLTDDEFRFGYEELALDEFPRDVSWTSKPSAAELDKIHVTVIGGGFSGLAMAVQLGRLGIPYTLVERQSGIGGVWLTNRYPGARVDVPSFNYQYKFEKNYPWKSLFPKRNETLEYLNHVAAKFGVLPNCSFNTQVERAEWVERDAQWEITVSDGTGEHRTSRTNFIICAAGLFSTPLEADFPGKSEFRGQVVHTTQWNESVDHRGKKVALIGNGSSGAQLAPSIVGEVESLTVFQRTPHWVMPMPGYLDQWSEESRWLFDNIPYYWNWFSYTAFLAILNLEVLQDYDPEWQKSGGAINELNDNLRTMLMEHIEAEVGDRPDLLERVIPQVAPLGRRFVVDMGWYDTLKRDNVRLVTDGISHFDADGVVTTDGTSHPADLVVLATGFQVSKYFFPITFIGRDSATLDELWDKDGARAFLSMTFPGMPNMFAMYGPSGQARTGGFPMWTEIWTRYILEGIVSLIESGQSSMEVRRDVFEAYNESVDEADTKVLWQKEGKGSYYLNAFGRNELNCPFHVQDAFLSMETMNLSDYHVK